MHTKRCGLPSYYPQFHQMCLSVQSQKAGEAIANRFDLSEDHVRRSAIMGLQKQPAMGYDPHIASGKCCSYEPRYIENEASVSTRRGVLSKPPELPSSFYVSNDIGQFSQTALTFVNSLTNAVPLICVSSKSKCDRDCFCLACSMFLKSGIRCHDGCNELNLYLNLSFYICPYIARRTLQP